MGKNDKDRFLKELAIRYCLARRTIPFLEVIVKSTSDLSDTAEVLTDIDVMGVECLGDGGLRRTVFDCKTNNKMSSINRAFWASGVSEYTGCDEAYVILKSRAVNNHRISALDINVDLHDEASFRDLGRTVDPAFPADNYYQASIDRWIDLEGCYSKNHWAAGLYELTKNAVPLTRSPSGTFRRILSELRNTCGEFDPAKDPHISIFFDTLASAFVLWAVLGRDIRRFYEPTMQKQPFEKILRYYLWGGKDAYDIRQQMRNQYTTKNNSAVELPSWEMLVKFAGLIVSSPQSVLECAHVCRELSIKMSSSSNIDFDKALSERLKENSRIRQFSVELSDYLVASCGLPSDMGKRVQDLLFAS